MWWKLSALVVVTVTLVFSVIPLRTHAAMYDPANPPKPWTFRLVLANMYLTPAAGVLIALILAVAVFVGIRIVRGRR